MFAELLAVMAPVPFDAGVGHARVRPGYAYPIEFVSRIVLNVGSLCLTLVALMHARVDLRNFGRMALASALICVCMAALDWVAARFERQEWQVLVPTYNFPDVGNVSLPVYLYAFGEVGMTLAVVFYLIMSIGNLSLGVLWMGGEHSWRPLLGNPTLLGVLLALLLMGFDLQLPRWVASTVDLIAGLTIPSMLIILGVSLASARPRQLDNGFSYDGLRLLLGVLMGWLVALALQLPPLAQEVLVVQSSMLVAVFNYPYALRGNRSPDQVASLVLCSTLLSFAFIPLLLTQWLPALRQPRGGTQRVSSRVP